jgi:hypothetical protein
MSNQAVTLDQALDVSERLSAKDQLRLISLLSERLQSKVERDVEDIDLLSLAGLGAEIWAQIDVADYLEQERASWNS